MFLLYQDEQLLCSSSTRVNNCYVLAVLVNNYYVLAVLGEQLLCAYSSSLNNYLCAGHTIVNNNLCAGSTRVNNYYVSGTRANIE